jgi:hypothetical protein
MEDLVCLPCQGKGWTFFFAKCHSTRAGTRAARRLVDALTGHLGATFVGHDSNPQLWLLSEGSQSSAMDIAIPHDLSFAPPALMLHP